MKNTIIVVLVLIIIGVGAYYFTKSMQSEPVDFANDTNVTENDEKVNNDETEKVDQVQDKTKTVIGTSVKGNDITAYHYGEGENNLLFVGGIHGGYEWNTVLVAYQLMDYLEENQKAVPANVRVTVIPVLNPDGLEKTVGTAGRFSASDVPTNNEQVIAGRFNANNVDLNRNFDCDWKSSAVWQSKTVSGGSSAFSEPESQALKSFISSLNPKGVFVWYSAAGGVYASSCHNGVLAETSALTKLFAEASKYPAHEEFNFYEITGDAVNWLAKENIPAISILLTNHTDTEWDKNLAGIKAVLDYFAK